MDPLAVLPEDVFQHALAFLDAADLCRAAAVCKDWRILADSECLWSRLCQRRWRKKVPVAANCFLPPHVPSADEDMGVEGRYWKARYGAVEMELRRKTITFEDLTRTAWRFRLKYCLSAQHDRVLRMFQEDHTYVCPWPNMMWALVDATAEDRLATPQERTTKREGSHVQVDEFPPLTATRAADWSWVLSNNFVQLNSIGYNVTAVPE